MAKNLNESKSNTVNLAAEDDSSEPQDHLLPNLDHILDDIPDLGYDSKAITERGITPEHEKGTSSTREAEDPEGDSTQEGGWISSEPEFDNWVDRWMGNTGNAGTAGNALAAEDVTGADDASSPTDLTDWSTLEPSGFPHTFEDPAFADPNLMEYPGTTEQQGFDEPLLDG